MIGKAGIIYTLTGCGTSSDGNEAEIKAFYHPQVQIRNRTFCLELVTSTLKNAVLPQNSSAGCLRYMCHIRMIFGGRYC